MPRVVPSQVVRFISLVTPRDRDGLVMMNSIEPRTFRGLLNLLDQIPDELLTMDSEAYQSLVVAKEDIREMLATWSLDESRGFQRRPFDRIAVQNPLAHIRDALAKCPDESPAPGTSELSFIGDADLRTELRSDIGAINRALANGEWKAATVLAGSAAEAILLWALKQRTRAEIAAAIGRASGKFRKKPDPDDLDGWTLHECIEVGAEVGVIKAETAIQTRLAKDFRNLIHPGRAQRLAQKCDRGTALSAVAGVEHIVRDLTP